MFFINIGGATRLSVKEILSYSAPNSAAIKKIMNTAREESRYVDVTGRKPTLCVLFTKGGYVYASPLRPETIDKKVHNIEAFMAKDAKDKESED